MRMNANAFAIATWILLLLYWRRTARAVKPTKEAQGAAARLARLPVWFGYTLFALCWAYPLGPVATRRTAATEAAAIVCCAVGLAFGVWARRTLGANWSQDVELKVEHKLVQEGPYALARHPIYTAHLALGLGTAIASGYTIGYLGAAVFLVGFVAKLRQEERLLMRAFPADYAEYRARVKALIPYLF